MKSTVSPTVSAPVAPNQPATVGASSTMASPAPAITPTAAKAARQPERAASRDLAGAEVLADQGRGRGREAEPRHEREREDAHADHVGGDGLGPEARDDAQEHEQPELPGELLDGGRQPDAQDAPHALPRDAVEPGAALDGEVVALPEHEVDEGAGEEGEARRDRGPRRGEARRAP